MEFGGSEANVGAALANWGLPVRHLTVFPEHALGRAAAADLRKKGIDDGLVHYGPGRMGLYFLEKGAASRGSHILYDRQNSSFSTYKWQDKKWVEVLQDVSWIHWSGITPAISENSAILLEEILSCAARLKIPVSGDLNYRSAMWTYGKSPQEIMPLLMKKSRLWIAGLRDINQCLGTAYDSFEEAKKAVFDQFEQLDFLVNTDRNILSASSNILSARLDSRQESLVTQQVKIEPIIDRIGTGDAFAAGLIYGLLTDTSLQETLDLGLAATVYKHTIPGDTLMGTIEEIKESLAAGGGRIKR